MNWWNVFSGSAERVHRHVSDPALTSLPDGYTFAGSSDLTQDLVNGMQDCMTRNGVKPYSGRMIAGIDGTFGSGCHLQHRRESRGDSAWPSAL